MAQETMGDVAALEQRLRDRFPMAMFEVIQLTSGAFMLDMRIGRRFFVVAFSPTHGFGVDEVHEGDAIDSSYRYSANGIDDVVRQLADLVEQGALRDS